MQQYISMNNIQIRQPDSALGYAFESTYSDGTTRAISGPLHEEVLFTVEQLSYTASFLSIQEMKQILQIIAKGKRFLLHYFSPYYGAWRDDSFYVGKGSLSIGRLNIDRERFESLSFNMIGVNPI